MAIDISGISNKQRGEKWTAANSNLLVSAVMETQGGIDSINNALYGEPVIYLGQLDYNTGYYSSTGAFTPSDTVKNALVNIKTFVGYNISVSPSVLQYAFVKSIGEDSIVFCDGCSRESGTPTNLLVPSDCNYLYLYIGSSTIYDRNITSTMPQGLSVDVEEIEENVEEIYVDIHGDNIQQPNENDVINDSITSTGIWQGEYYSLMIPVTNFRGKHITSSSGSQYALIASYTGTDTKVEFVIGGSRISGTPTNLLIPDDANYLYILIGVSTYSIPKLEIEESTVIGLEEKVDAVSCASLYYEKKENEITLYKKISNTNYYFAIPILHRVRPFSDGEYPSFYDNWGIRTPYLATYANGVMVKTLQLFQAGEAEMAIRVESGNTSTPFAYVGGGMHGFENIMTVDNGRLITILVDNQTISEDSVIALKPFESFDMIEKAEIYQAWTNTNPWAYATKRWRLSVYENLNITTNVEIIRALDIKQAQFGMFCVFRRSLGDSSNPYLTNRALKDNDQFKIWEVEDGWDSDPSTLPLRTKDPYCKKIIEWGELGFGFSMAISNETLKDNGGLYIGTNGSAYNKIYFDLTGEYTPQVGEVLKATQIWDMSYSN